jgi:hypothetical protein
MLVKSITTARRATNNLPVLFIIISFLNFYRQLIIAHCAKYFNIIFKIKYFRAFCTKIIAFYWQATLRKMTSQEPLSFYPDRDNREGTESAIRRWKNTRRRSYFDSIALKDKMACRQKFYILFSENLCHRASLGYQPFISLIYLYAYKCKQKIIIFKYF